MTELRFDVMTKPHSFDLEDEIENMLNDSGIQEELEETVREVLERHYDKPSVQIGVELVP